MPLGEQLHRQTQLSLFLRLHRYDRHSTWPKDHLVGNDSELRFDQPIDESDDNINACFERDCDSTDWRVVTVSCDARVLRHDDLLVLTRDRAPQAKQSQRPPRAG